MSFVDNFDNMSIEEYEKLSPEKRNLIIFIALQQIHGNVKKKCVNCPTKTRLNYLITAVIVVTGVAYTALGYLAKAIYAHVGGSGGN